MSLSVAVAGASGYAGGELLRLLSQHPDLEVTTVTAFGNAGQELVSVHPHLRSYAGLVLKETTGETLAGHDVVFLALPHGKSGELAEQLSDDTIVVDCGADHRLTSSADWDAFYGGDYYGAWAYGLPELVLADGSRQRSKLVGATRIAVPGCNVTAMTLGLAPGIAAGVVSAAGCRRGAGRRRLRGGQEGQDRTARQRTPRLRARLRGRRHPSAFPRGAAKPARGRRHATSASRSPRCSCRCPAASSPRRRRSSPPGVGAARGARRLGRRLRRGAVRRTCCPEGRFPASGDTLGANTALIGVTVDESAGRVVAVVGDRQPHQGHRRRRRSSASTSPSVSTRPSASA